ncbi:MAG: hypothetical protein NVSMB30_02580 [Hymenobacter sp.]
MGVLAGRVVAVAGPLAQLHSLQVDYAAGLDTEAQQRAHLMEPVPARRARVEVQQPQLLIGHHPQDVRVARDKKPRPGGGQQGPGRGHVVAGVAANVGNYHAQALEVKVLHQGLGAAHVRAVDIAVHAPQARR